MTENEQKLIDQILFSDLEKIDLSDLGLAETEQHLDDEQRLRAQIAAIVLDYFKNS